LRRSGILKVGAATVAAAAGVILAITSVMAHTSQATALHVAPSKSLVASLMTSIEDKQDAAEAAELLAAEQRKAARLAAKLQHQAAVAAEEAAESSATEAAEDSTVTAPDTDNETADTDTDTDTDTQDGPDTQDNTPEPPDNQPEPPDTETD
jgi:hypothetical protein